MHQDSPTGAVGRHLITSLSNAFKYGKLGESLKSGNRSGPTTLSSSSCAFNCAEGYRIIASTKVSKADIIVSVPPSDRYLGEMNRVIMID